MIRMTSTRIDSIQGLRAIAALLVVVDHSMSIMISKGSLLGIDSHFAWLFGGIGVKIFFLISGFIMTVTTHGEFSSAGASKRFLYKRFLRVAPLYWIATTAYAARISLQGTPPHFASLIFSFLFIPQRNDLGIMQPVYGLGWTLNFEMFFYVLFGLALQFNIWKGMSGLIGSLIGLVLIVKLGAFALVPDPLGLRLSFGATPSCCFLLAASLSA